MVFTSLRKTYENTREIAPKERGSPGSGDPVIGPRQRESFWDERAYPPQKPVFYADA
jgi:hypothetical protein